MHVLLCDDHQMFVEVLGVVLRARGYRITCTTSPGAALEVVGKHAVDVCLLDLHFPEGSGIPTITDILEASPATRVVVLSGSTDVNVLGRALLAGARGVAAKGEGVGRIVDVVERVHAGEVVVEGAGLRDLAELAVAAPPTPAQHLARFLTEREREVLACLVRGSSTARLAEELGVRYSTARTHIQNILTKLGVHSKLEAVALAVHEGLVTVPAGRSPRSARGG